MVTVNDYVQNKIANHDEQVNSWGDMKQRRNEVFNYEVGDVLKFPDTPTILKTVFDSGTEARYTPLECIDGPHKGMILPFYGGTFEKGATVYNEPSTAKAAPLPVIPFKRVSTGGTAVALYRTVDSRDAGLKLFNGKTIKVVAQHPVRTVRYGETNISTVVIYDFDLVEEAPAE